MNKTEAMPLITDLLKERTLGPHQQLEKLVIGIIKNIASTDDYVNLLQPFYGFFAATEKLLEPFIDADTLPDYTLRRKASSIKHDIDALGGTTGSLPNTRQLPCIRTIEDAFGALYVLEGSTLGGQYIAKMITDKLGLPNTDCLTFFKSYGTDTPKMWQVYQQALNDRATSNADQQIVIAAANETFLKFKQWIEEYGN
jgi:heme oxygenase